MIIRKGKLSVEKIVTTVEFKREQEIMICYSGRGRGRTNLLWRSKTLIVAALMVMSEHSSE